MASSSTKRIRIGFIGVGSMGQAAHLRNYVSLPEDCEVVALAELRPELGARVAARYGVPKVYRNHEELLANEKVDALVASHLFQRYGVLMPVLAQAGIPIMSEKPLAGSIEAGEKIVKALEENKTWLMVGYHRRSDLGISYAKAEIDRLKASGELGKFRYLRMTVPGGDWAAGLLKDNITTSEPIPELEVDPPPSGMDGKAAIENAWILNYYTHHINLMRHLLGEDYKVTYADATKTVMIIQSVSGIPGVLEMNPYSPSIGWQETILATFDQGYVKIDVPAPLAQNQAGRVTIYRDPGKGAVPVTLSPEMPPVHAMRNQALNFIKAVRGESSAPCLAQEALRDLYTARDYVRLLTGYKPSIFERLFGGDTK